MSGGRGSQVAGGGVVAPAEPAYPRFSDDEMARRRAALSLVASEAGVDHLVLYGANRFGSAVPWLTRWPVTREAIVVFSADGRERDSLFVGFYNHVPNASRIATEAVVDYIGAKPAMTAVDELRRRGATSVGVIGPLGWRAFGVLSDAFSRVVGLDAEYNRLRWVKSDEELSWLRVGCEMTDRAVLAMQAAAAPGVDERELGLACESAYLGEGGTTHIHYFAATPMDAPVQSVPAQWPSSRRLAAGDVLTCEVSAAWWDYPGQALRTFTVDAEPSPLLRELHEVADAAFDAVSALLRPGVRAAELVEASRVIGEAGFTTRDDLVHGFVGGYLPPVLGDTTRQIDAVPELTLEEGMTLVVQPNVVTRDESAGVQTGELLLVGASGPERLHSVPRGLLAAGPGPGLSSG